MCELASAGEGTASSGAAVSSSTAAVLDSDEEATLKTRIRLHYNVLSALYRELWGHHIHHGYWVTGDETKEVAQRQLIQQLADRAQLSSRAQTVQQQYQRPLRVLDIGCGLGGSALHLARVYGAHVVGVTISAEQVKLAEQLAATELTADSNPLHGRVTYLEMDAEQLQLPDDDGKNGGYFDVVRLVEALSHMPQGHRVWPCPPSAASRWGIRHRRLAQGAVPHRRSAHRVHCAH